MKTIWKVFIISVMSLIFVAIAGSIFVFSFQDKAYSYEENIKAAKSDINVQEKRRSDLIYNLADCVKSYDEHEAYTIIELAKERSGGGTVDNASTVISGIVESYPDLKSSENYKELMNELSVTENNIANYRENYNQTVKTYNRYVKKAMNKFFLSITNYEVMNYEYLEYEVSEDAPQDLFGD